MRSIAKVVAMIALSACALDQPEPEPEIEIVAKQSANSLSENAIAMFATELDQLVNAPLAQSRPLATMAVGLFGRRLLHYTAHCALRRGDSVAFVDAAGTPRTIPSGPIMIAGVPTVPGLGLAPDWPKRALTHDEQRWVMGCTLAHINAKGKLVDISLRGSSPALATTPAELTDEPFLEGAFYGEYLDPRDPDTAALTRQYACWGPGLAKCSNPALALWGRLCTRGGCEHLTVVGACERTGSMPATAPVACAPRTGDAYAQCYTETVAGAPGPQVGVYTAGVVTTYLHEVSCDP